MNSVRSCRWWIETHEHQPRYCVVRSVDGRPSKVGALYTYNSAVRCMCWSRFLTLLNPLAVESEPPEVRSK